MTLEEMTNAEIAKFLRVISSNALSTTFTYVSIATIADRLDALSTQQPAPIPVVIHTTSAESHPNRSIFYFQYASLVVQDNCSHLGFCKPQHHQTSETH